MNNLPHRFLGLRNDLCTDSGGELHERQATERRGEQQHAHVRAQQPQRRRDPHEAREHASPPSDRHVVQTIGNEGVSLFDAKLAKVSTECNGHDASDHGCLRRRPRCFEVSTRAVRLAAMEVKLPSMPYFGFSPSAYKYQNHRKSNAPLLKFDMRRGILGSLLLFVLALATVASAQSSSGSTSASIFANSTTASSNASSSTTQTQCEICMGGGDCSKAYNGVAGQYCNKWIDSSRTIRPCCCPASDVCSSDTNYECTCRHKSDRPSYWVWIGLGVFAIGALIGGGIFTAIRKRRMQQRDSRDFPAGAGVAYAQQPVYASGGYAQQGYAPGTYAQPVYAQGGYAQPTYVQPGYGPGGYRDDYGRGGRRGMGTGGAVAMGAAGGLLGGLLIGEALGDAGGGGGGEFAGDF